MRLQEEMPREWMKKIRKQGWVTALDIAQGTLSLGVQQLHASQHLGDHAPGTQKIASKQEANGSATESSQEETECPICRVANANPLLTVAGYALFLNAQNVQRCLIPAMPGIESASTVIPPSRAPPRV